MPKTRDRFAFLMLTLCLLFAIGQLGFNAATLDTWMDEGKYLMKGYWYLTGLIAPYSKIDPTFYMPLSFYPVASMEWLFGTGYFPGRILMILFALACLILVYLAGTRIGHSRLAGVAATALVVGHPVTLTYFATATPYAMVSCLSLALILVLLIVKSRRIAFGASGAILWALLFTRPDMLPIAMIPTGWALLIEPRRNLAYLAITFLTFIALSVLTIWIFGPGLLQVVLEVPGVAQIARVLGIPAPPIAGIMPLTVSPLDPSLPLREVPIYFYVYFLRPYLAMTIVTLVMIAFRIFSACWETSERRLKPIDLILAYFWITAILHYLLSLSYCIDCIIPYTNYFLPLGALAAAGLIGEIFRLTRDPRPVYAALGAVFVVAAIMQTFPYFPTLLRPLTGKILTTAIELSTQLRPTLPATGRILVLCDSVEASQAVWLSGGVIEPRSLYLPTTYREPKPGLTKDERDRMDSIIWDAGLWSEGSMRSALTQEFRTLLIERRTAYGDTIVKTVRDGIPFGDLVAMYFRLTATATVGERTFELYQRRE
jgi:hypothetical protein